MSEFFRGSEPESTEKEQCIRFLSWDTLLQFEEKGIGFRHTSEEQASEEAEHSFTGDSIALCEMARLVPKDFYPEALAKLSETHRVLPTLNQLSSQLSQQEKNQIITEAQRSIGGFIEMSIFMDIVPEQYQDLLNDIIEGKIPSAFTLIEYGPNSSSSYGSDDTYFGLPKIGLKSITNKQIIGAITPSDYLKGLPNMHDIKNIPQEDLEGLTYLVISNITDRIIQRIENIIQNKSKK
jgi:hypothetical protein